MTETATLTIKQTLTDAMKAAMKAKDKERLGTIRQILAAFKQIEVDERIEIDDQRALQILDKQAKQRKDSISQFKEAGRDDLVETEEKELVVIQSFLPQALTEQELNTIIDAAFEQAKPESMRDMGKVMGIIKPQVQGRADMGAVSQQIKQRLS